MLAKLKSYLDRTIDWAVVGLVVAMVAVAFYQVVMRYIFNNAPSWSEELARYLFVWLVFLASAIAFRGGAHLGIDYFVNLFPVRVRSFFRVAIGLLLCVALLFLAVKGFNVATLVQRQLSAAMRMPMIYAYLAIPVGALLMLLEVVWRLAQPGPTASERGD